MTVSLRSLPLRDSKALGWSPKRGPRCRFRTFSVRPDGEVVTYLPDQDAPVKHPDERLYKDIGGQRWYAFDCWYAHRDSLGPLRWVLKTATRGRGRPSAEESRIAASLRWWVIDHEEFLESSSGDRRLVSHINTKALLPEPKDRLIEVCKRFNLTWMEEPPPASWSHPERAMVTIMSGVPT